MEKKLVSTAILIVMGLLMGFYLGSSGMISSGGGIQAIEYSYIYSTKRADVENAEWKIVLYVVNRGEVPLELNEVFVNGQEANVYGLIHGDKLPEGSMIGASLPNQGLKLDKGKGVEVFIWIGGELFDPGDEVSVSFNPINHIKKSASVPLVS